MKNRNIMENTKEIKTNIDKKDLKVMNENMGIVYKDKEKPRSDYKCKILGRTIHEE